MVECGYVFVCVCVPKLVEVMPSAFGTNIQEFQADGCVIHVGDGNTAPDPVSKSEKARL